MPKGIRGFQKGNPGRPKKSGGSITKSSKEQLRELFNKNIPKIFKELEGLKGTQYFNALSVIAPYALPRLSVTDMQVTTNQIDDKYKGLSVDALRKIRQIMDEDKDNPDIKLIENE